MKLVLRLTWLPRICRQQAHRASTIGGVFDSYNIGLTSICTAYYYSTLSLMTSRYSLYSSNSSQFNLLYLHPKMMQDLQREDFGERIAVSYEPYQTDILECEVLNWIDFLQTNEDNFKEWVVCGELLQQCCFFPAVKQSVRGFQYVQSMMRKCIMLKIGGKQKT